LAEEGWLDVSQGRAVRTQHVSGDDLTLAYGPKAQTTVTTAAASAPCTATRWWRGNGKRLRASGRAARVVRLLMCAIDI
ncbi:MAG: hypothetical protein ACXW13_12060, partial [Burkholderiaceae bacterium]